ncbi:MAG: putative lipid II flippase FtsW [Legionellales bacterium]|nr:putative lipid II flippase FtsW [Legionellales bacterium]
MRASNLHLTRPTSRTLVLYDRWLLMAALILVTLGLLMVASSSMTVAQQYYQQSFYFLIRQSIHLLAGVIATFIVIRIDTQVWQKLSGWLLLIGVALLVLVLIPGIGRTVNGSTRWIGFGPFSLQVSELVKCWTIMYLAGYIARHRLALRCDWISFLKPLMIVGVIALLLLGQPDFGASVVILLTCLGMLFLAGVRLWQYAVVMAMATAGFAMIAISSPYRLARITGFLNPWADQFDSGYQLTQSLIAFGRGGWFGNGLGESVQKLFYLPEAHTDFIFAILTEELGLIGGLGVIVLFAIIIWRGMAIARRALLHEQWTVGYLAYGFTLWLGLQAIINIGVSTGLLPTKGITLPLVSYGGSSLIVTCIVVGLLLRIDYEIRWKILGLGVSRGKL